jgi:hypothetical protein
MKRGSQQQRREEVTSLAAIENGEEKAAKRKKRSRRGKQERGGEDPNLQAQGVNGLDWQRRQGGKGREVGLTLTEGSEPNPSATKPMKGYIGARST